MNNFYGFIFLCICLLSCTTNTSHPPKLPSYSKESIHPDSMITLRGILHVNSKGAFLFKGRNHASEGRGSATYLIPHNEDLKTYIERHYDAHLHLKDLDEPFLVLIEGNYLTDNLVNAQDSTSFLFNFVALIDETALVEES